MSREIWSRAELERDGARNDGTSIFRPPLPDSAGGPPAGPSAGESFATLFQAHYPVLRELLSRHREPGLLMLVAAGARLEATAWFAAREDDICSLILGRHNACDVFLPDSPGLSLRHLALVLHRLGRDAAAVRYRVCDLRTAAGFRDENGRRLEALESRGPLLVGCGGSAVLLFPTSAAAAPWPKSGEEAWRLVPDRLYLEGSEPDPDRPPLQAQAGASQWPSHGGTLALTFPGPRFAGPAPDVSDPATGELVIDTPGGSAALHVGPRAARRGILLGRYERCDGGALPLLGPELSRVHLLVVEVDGELHAIDTCSKNGTWEGGRPVRSVRLLPNVTLTLARHTRISWRPFH